MAQLLSERDVEYGRLNTQKDESEGPVSEHVRAFLARALEQFRLVEETETTMREEMLEDRRFRAADQWPDTIKTDRSNDNRPCLTINRIPEFVRQVTNTQRQNRPGIQVSPVDSGADVKIAEVFQGIIRNIERQSDADVAYHHAAIDQVELGRGYWRIQTQRVNPRSFDLELRIKKIPNPFSVYMDPTVDAPEDARFAFIIEDIPRRAFEQRFPGAKMTSLKDFSAAGNNAQDWLPEGKVRIAEYFYVEHTKRTLLELWQYPTQGRAVMFEDEWDALVAANEPVASTDPSVWQVIDSIEIDEPTVKWCLISGAEILEGNESKTGGRDWPGKYIPIVPVFGDEVVVNGVRDYRGMIRDMRDPQRMVNYWESAITEQIALAPKAPFLIAEGQVEGYENQWNAANRRNFPYLPYKAIDLNGHPVPPPQRSVSEPPIQASVVAADRNDRNLQSVAGFHDASLGNITQQERSGKAIDSLLRQAELGSSNYIDNHSRAVRTTGKYLVDLIPKVYTHLQIIRIQGEDDKERQIAIHVGSPDAPSEEQLPDDISGIYDLGVGRYDVSVSSARSFETRRREASETLQKLVEAYPDMLPLVGDIMTENMDVPWARQVSARLKLLLPPGAQDDEGVEIPPVARAQIQQLEQKLEEMQQVIGEQAKQIETDQIKASGQLHIKQLETQSRERIASGQNDTEMRVAQLEAKIDLLVAQMKAQTDAAKAQMSARTATQAEDTKRGAAVLSARMAQQKPKPAARKSA